MAPKAVAAPKAINALYRLPRFLAVDKYMHEWQIMSLQRGLSLYVVYQCSIAFLDGHALQHR